MKYKHKFRIDEITSKSADKITFDYEGTDSNGEYIKNHLTIAEYFALKYKRLQYPNLPCIMVGRTTKRKYFPLEVCKLVENQYTTRERSEKVLSEMSEISAEKNPFARFNDIMRDVQKLQNESRVHTDQFNIELSINPVSLNGRVLPRPILNYKNTSFIPDENCSWYMQEPEKNSFPCTRNGILESADHEHIFEAWNLVKLC